MGVVQSTAATRAKHESRLSKPSPGTLQRTAMKLPADGARSARDRGRGGDVEDGHNLMLPNLYFKVEQERQMQRLAASYFGAWHFWCLFLPSASLTMLSGILAFLSTSEVVSSRLRFYLATAVGCLALVATFLQTVSDQLKLDSRAAMHRSAVLDLKRICDDLEFLVIARLESDAPRAELGEYKKLYAQIQQGCKSMVPLRVSQAFRVIDTRLILRMPSGNELEGAINNAMVYHLVWNELYCAISAYLLWPFGLPDPDRTVDRVLNSLHSRLAEELKAGGLNAGPSIGAMLKQRKKLAVRDDEEDE